MITLLALLNFHVKGEYFDLEKQREYLLAANGYGVEILNEKLETVSLYPMPGIAKQLSIRKDKVIVLDTRGLWLFRFKKGLLEPLDSVRLEDGSKLVTNQRYCIVSCKDSLFIFSLENKRIVLKKVLLFPGEIRTLGISKQKLWVGLRRDIFVVSLSEEEFSPINMLTTKATPSMIVLKNNLVLIGYETLDIEVYKEVGKNLKKISEISTLYVPIQAIFKGDKLYVAEGWRGVEVFRIDKEGKISKEDEISIMGWDVQKVIYDKKSLYIVSPTRGILRKRLKDFSDIVRTAEGDFVYSIAKGKDFFAVAKGDEGVWVTKIDSLLWQRVKYPIKRAISVTTVLDTFLCALDGRYLFTFSLTGTPSFKGRDKLFVPGTPFKVKTKDTLIFVLTKNEGLRIYSICPVCPVVEEGFYEFEGKPQDMVVKDSFVYIADSDSGLRVIDFTHPKKPWQTKLFNGIHPLTIEIKDSLLILGEEKRIRLFYLSTAQELEEIGKIVINETPYDMVIQDNILFVALGEKGVIAVDIEVPKKPTVKKFYDTPGIAKSLVATPSTLVIADRYSVISIPFEY